MSRYEGQDVVMRPTDTRLDGERLPTVEDEMRAIHDRAWDAFRDMMGEMDAFALRQSFNLHPDDPELRERIGMVIEDNVIGLVDAWTEGFVPEPKQMQLILAFYGIDRSQNYYDLSDYELVMARDGAYSAKMDAICEREQADAPVDQVARVDLPPASLPAEDRLLGFAPPRDLDNIADEDDDEDPKPPVIVH